MVQRPPARYPPARSDHDPTTRLTALGTDELAFLDRYGFDPDLFASWQRRLKAGELSTDNNRIRAKICAPAEGQIHDLPKKDTASRTEADAIGQAAIAAGELGVVILNGGMATRFGGVVKGVVPVLRGESFLGLRIRDTLAMAERFGGEIPIYLMNSFATDEKSTQAHLRRARQLRLWRRDAAPASFTQFVSVRLDPGGGEIFATWTTVRDRRPTAPATATSAFALRAIRHA